MSKSKSKSKSNEHVRWSRQMYKAHKHGARLHINTTMPLIYKRSILNKISEMKINTQKIEKIDFNCDKISQ